MAAFDPSPSGKQASDLVRDGGRSLLPLATKAAQALVAALWALPVSSASTADGGAGAAPVAPVPGRVVDLPRPSTPLPRTKPPPQPRAPTRWEAFAARKGIDTKKSKRSKLVFDETEGEWKRRHGYKRANDDADIPIVDAKPGDGPGTDPFAEAALAKKERVRKNREQQLGNLKASAKAASRSSLALPPTLALASSLPKHGSKGAPVKGESNRSTLKDAARQAGISTASMGKHDVLSKGERREERARALAGSRRSFAPLTGRGAGDRSRDAAVVDRILRETADDIGVDVPLAVSRLEQERRAAVKRSREEKSNGDGGEKDDDWRARGRKGVRRSKAGRPPGMHGALPASKKGKGGGGGVKGGGVGKKKK